MISPIDRPNDWHAENESDSEVFDQKFRRDLGYACRIKGRRSQIDIDIGSNKTTMSDKKSAYAAVAPKISTLRAVVKTAKLIEKRAE